MLGLRTQGNSVVGSNFNITQSIFDDKNNISGYLNFSKYQLPVHVFQILN